MSSWFQTTNFTSLAKNALKEAQKTIDKALDINQEQEQTEIRSHQEKEEESKDENEVEPAQVQMSSEGRAEASEGNTDGELISFSTINLFEADAEGDVNTLEATETETEVVEDQDDTSCQHQQEPQRLNSESDTNTVTITDLESSSATIMQDSRDNSDENDIELNPAFDEECAEDQVQPDGGGNQDQDQDQDNQEGNDEHRDSPTVDSSSSRPMSSVSAESEEKHEFDSNSHSPPPSSSNSNISGPSSPNEHSQMVIPISHPQPQKSTSTTSTPERGHSRSNSNSTCSSIDQQHHRQPQTLRPNITLPNQNQNQVYQSGGRIVTNFPLSSASSSDIEVIPLDSLESSMLFHMRRPSTAEVEIQTDSIIPTTDINVSNKMTNLLAEKEVEISQLREEGEKLSKKQFDLTTIIKKLRVKEKETEATIKTLKNEIDTKSIEIERVTKTFLQKESIEQKQVQTISKLNNEKTRLEDMVSDLRSKMEDSTENCASMKASLEDASIEILELQNTIASAHHDTTQIDTLTREKSELYQQNQSFKKEIEQLRLSLSSIQNKSSVTEQELKAQLLQQSQKIQNLETELGDATGEIADATMPLSIEIEKLQSELKVGELQFQKRERQLNDQLREMDLKLKQSMEREKSNQDHQNDFKSSIRQLESQIERLESDNNELNSQVKNLKEEIDTSNKNQQKLENQIRIQKEESEKFQFIVEKLELDLKTQCNLYETEKKKCIHIMEQLRQFQLQNNEQSQSLGNEMGGDTSPGQTRMTMSNRSPTMSEASYLEEVFETNHLNNNIGHSSHHLHNNIGTGLLTPKSSSFFDSLPVYNQASMSPHLEMIYTQLRLRENELIQLQSDCGKNEKIRKTLNDEIAKLTVENQQLDGKLEQLIDVQSKLMEVEKNYNAVLQLYGEKVEEVEELRMDLADVKEMFKTQVEQLVKK